MTTRFDDVIAGLVKEKLGTSKSFFGKGKGKISRFKKGGRIELHES